MTVRTTVLAVSGALLLTACASAEAAGPASSAERGRALVEANCASCHAVGREGVSPLAEAPPFRTLSRKYDVGALEEALAEGILVGHPAMPEFALEPAQVADVVAYLRSVQDPGPARRSAAPTSR